MTAHTPVTDAPPGGLWCAAALAWLLAVIAVGVHQWQFWTHDGIDTDKICPNPGVRMTLRTRTGDIDYLTLTFAELDADGDGSISMAEFGINPAQTGEMSMVSSTTTTTTYVNTAGETANGAEAIAGIDAAQALAAATGAPEAAAEPTTVTAAADPLQELIGSVDSDGDGQISGAELNTFVAQLSSQLEAASKKYNDVALASASGAKTLDEAA